MISAMTSISVLTLVLLVLGASAAVGVLVALARAVHHDGYGTRPPPRSHLPWDADLNP